MTAPVRKPCRVLYISSTYSRDEKDNQNPWMIDTIRHLRARGYEIEVLAPSFKGLRTHTVGGVLVHRFRYFFRDREALTHDQGAPNKIRGSLFFKLLLFPYVFFGMLAAMRVARKGRYDFIHCHWPFPHGLMGWAACLAAPGRPRLILHFHGACLLLAAKFKPIAPILRFCLRRARGVVSNSGFTAGLVAKLMPVEQSVIGFGSPLEGDPLPPARNRTKVILTVGRVVERKGIAYLLRALPKVAAVLDAKVAIVGKGDPKVEADLRALAAELGLGDRVEFAGKVPEADLIRWYRTCDVFCLPAIVDSQGETEGLGVVLLEALNYARPVVASNVGGIPDIIKDGRTGLLCPEKDPEALAAALLQLLSDPRLGETLGRQGHEFVRREFSWEHIVALWEAFYARASAPE
ncbi:MAG TPA: glycosyltransferase family 4 protein [Fibrobacteria bacterium]|nr:glycosyltransferase family 4 protein [Fibrobacteria bacterium]